MNNIPPYIRLEIHLSAKRCRGVVIPGAGLVLIIAITKSYSYLTSVTETAIILN